MPSEPLHFAPPLGPQIVSVNEVSILPLLLFSCLLGVSFWSRFPLPVLAQHILPLSLSPRALSLRVSYSIRGTNVTTLLKMVEPLE